MKLCVFVIAILLLTSSYAEDSIFIEWKRIEGATAVHGTKTFRVYLNPSADGGILIYPSCWYIDRTRRKAMLPNCHFQLYKGKLLFDTSAGDLSGVSWGDPKTDISIISAIFRRPKFSKNSVSLWDDGAWMQVTGLPTIEYE